MILIDTSVWSTALRRRTRPRQGEDAAVFREWTTLVTQARAVLIPAVRQELLSGIRHPEQFARLQSILDGSDSIPSAVSTHDRAAACYNACAASGVAAGHVDMLLCATSIETCLPVFTVDQDFHRYARHLPIALHRIP